MSIETLFWLTLALLFAQHLLFWWVWGRFNALSQLLAYHLLHSNHWLRTQLELTGDELAAAQEGMRIPEGVSGVVDEITTGGGRIG